MNDAPLTTCPVCGEDALKKQIAAPAFTFKGGGWYKDLYSTPGAKPEKKSDSGGSEKTESKPAAKKETTSTTSD
jgi:predicted nucleic acid-binding Zn ribbon protein